MVVQNDANPHKTTMPDKTTMADRFVQNEKNFSFPLVRTLAMTRDYSTAHAGAHVRGDEKLVNRAQVRDRPQ